MAQRSIDLAKNVGFVIWTIDGWTSFKAWVWWKLSSMRLPKTHLQQIQLWPWQNWVPSCTIYIRSIFNILPEHSHSSWLSVLFETSTRRPCQLWPLRSVTNFKCPWLTRSPWKRERSLQLPVFSTKWFSRMGWNLEHASLCQLIWIVSPQLVPAMCTF